MGGVAGRLGVSCVFGVVIFFFKQKTAYEMRISDWSSDVCSSDLHKHLVEPHHISPVFDPLTDVQPPNAVIRRNRPLVAGCTRRAEPSHIHQVRLDGAISLCRPVTHPTVTMPAEKLMATPVGSDTNVGTAMYREDMCLYVLLI